MRPQRLFVRLGCLAACLVAVRAQPPQGPFPPEQWPVSANKDQVVHFVSVGDAFQPLSDKWITGNMNILTGGDQVTEAIKIGGFDGLKVTGNYLNTADGDYTEWADDEAIDILMQVYGDGALFQANGDPRNFNFLIGTLPELGIPSWRPDSRRSAESQVELGALPHPEHDSPQRWHAAGRFDPSQRPGRHASGRS